MDTDRLRERVQYRAEVAGVKTKSWIRLSLQVLGMVAIVVTAWNVFAPVVNQPALFGWGEPFEFAIWLNPPGNPGTPVAAYVPDLLLMAGGMVLAYVAS